MNPPPKKPFIGKILPGNIFFPDPYPKYTEDVTILNTAPKFGDLCSLFQQLDNRYLESGWKIAVGCRRNRIRFWCLDEKDGATSVCEGESV